MVRLLGEASRRPSLRALAYGLMPDHSYLAYRPNGTGT